MNQKKSEDAVSPVIGVMLLLVVTIVIAAVVAVFASGVGTDVEPAPATVVDVVSISDGYYGEGEVEWRPTELGEEKIDWDNPLPGNEDGLLENWNGYTYSYFKIKDTDTIVVRQSSTNWKNEPYGEESVWKDYLTYEQGEPEFIEEKTITISCLHGDSLDLSKISIQITYNEPSGSLYVFEIPSNSYSGSFSAGDTQKLKLESSDTNFYKVMENAKVDVTVFYGDYVIATEEKLKVTRG